MKRLILLAALAVLPAFGQNFPNITSISPDNAPAGSPNLILTLNGSFSTQAGCTSTVQWQVPGGPTTNLTLAGFPTAVQIQATVPATLLTTAGTRNVWVEGTCSGASNTVTFTITPVAAITNLSATSRSAGALGFTMFVNGSGFVPAANTAGSIVEWTVGAVTTQLATSYVVAGQLAATVTTALLANPGTATVTVRNPNNTVSNGVTFTINAPVISTLTPASRTAGAPGNFQLIVTGSGFLSNSLYPAPNITSQVRFGATTVGTTYNNDTQLTATVPANLITVPGTVNVTVQNPAGSSPNGLISGPVAFTVLPPPTVTSTAPNTRTVNNGPFLITLTGTNFRSDHAVYWDAVNLVNSTTFVNATQMTAIIPAAQVTLGNHTVSVTSGDGVPSNSVNFTVTAVPTTTGLNPANIRAGSAGFTLAVTGTDFLNNMTVQWNGAALTTTFVNANQLNAAVPAGNIATSGTANITVVTADGVVSNSQIFRILTNPQITSINPPSAAAGTSPLNLTINGSDFVPPTGGNLPSPGSTAVWTVGATSTDLVTTYVNATQLQAAVPAALANVAGTASITIRNPDTMLSAPVSFVVSPPAISSLVPSSRTAGATGFTLTVNGSSFVLNVGAAAVAAVISFGGTALPTTFVGSTQLTANVPANLIATPGTVNVTVTNPGGSVSAASPFTILSPPTISNLSPSPVTAGSGAFTLTVNGANIPAGATVQWNGSPLTTNIVNATQATAAVPAALIAAPGSANITIMTSDGVPSNTVALPILSQPVIGSITPPGAFAGASPLNLTVNGSGYLTGATVVWTVGAVSTNLVTTFVSFTQLQASVPSALANVPGTASITVRNPDGTVSPAVAFVLTPPAISSLVPSSRTAGAAAFTLTVNGSSFLSNPGPAPVTSVVYFGATALATTFIGSGQLTANVPAALIAAPGTVNVTVQNPGGSVSAPVPFTVLAPPTISSLNPNQVNAGSGAFPLTVNGANISGGATVQWNGTPLTTTVVNATQATAAVPAALIASPGSATITIVTSDGVVSNSATLTILSVPVIGSISPPGASAGASPLNLTVNGSGFLNGATVVWTAGATSTNLATTFVGGAQLQAPVPAALSSVPGTVSITVRNPDGVVSPAVAFVLTPPAISSLVPSSRTAGAAAFTLTVNGSSFVSNPGAAPVTSVIYFGGTPLVTTFVGAGQLTASVPANLIATPGIVNVTVQNPGGAASAASPFTVLPAPTIASLTPNVVNAGAVAFTLVVNGANIPAGAVVQWNGAPLATSVVSANQANAAVPAALVAAPGSANVTVVTADGVASNTAVFTIEPAPVITQLAPAFRTATGPAFTLTVTGMNFPSGSVVQWNGIHLITTAPAAGTLSAGVPASLIAAPGSANITVITPAGSVSAPVAFPINPAPVLTAINPVFVVTGGPAFSLTVTGSNFANGMTVIWAGVPLATSFVSANQMTGAVPASLITAVGAPNITVVSADGVSSGAIPIAVVPPLVLNTTSLPEATESVPYFAPLSAAGGTPPYTWTLTGALPRGLQLAANGAIGGTPSGVGSATFTVTVTDSRGLTQSRSLFINVVMKVPSLEIDTTTLTRGTVGAAYSQGLSASGGEPPYGWSATGLPPGLSLNSNGTITGKPTKAGVYAVSVQVSDSGGRSASRNYSLEIVAPPLLITTAAAADGQVGAAYSQTFTATGGTPPYQWSASGGTLPPPTTLNSSGVLSGTPNSAGTFNFTVTVTDSAKQVATKGFTVIIGAPQLTITTGSLPSGTVNVPYSAALSASGGVPPYRWSGGGGGLSVDGGGSISGTPAQPGTITLTAQVTDSQGANASKSFEITIAGPLLTITTSSLPAATVGVPYSAGFTAAGGTPPYRWSMPAGWAGGLTFNSDGSLGGTPTDAGEYSITVRVTDSQGQIASRGFSITIDSPVLTVATAALPQGMVGSGYYTILTATGNIGPVTWSGDGLPAGLSVDSGGAVSGTPMAAGTFTVTARARDQGGRTASRALSLTIGLPAAPPVTFTGVPDVSDPARQPAIQVSLGATYPVPLTGVVTLTFAPLAGRDDPAVQFSTGGRTATFTVPAGSTTANFSVPNLGLQTGTVAGTITLTVSLNAGGTDVTPSPAPTRVIRINPSAPTLSDLRITRTATGFEVQLTGFSTTREVTQAVFRFTAAAGANLQTTEVTINVEQLFSSWFSGAASAVHGGRFTFTQPFTISGDTAAITSISVTLVSRQGNSNSLSGNLQ
ncbi:MAG: beta strand repeat-containing protein [Bryobacteraceae bacterium]